jgi:hypothetical protein
MGDGEYPGKGELWEEFHPRVLAYGPHIRAAADWLAESERPSGGSAAYFTPFGGWSRAYPETTGCLIGTLLNLEAMRVRPMEAYAVRCGEWLLSIQNGDGSWNRGLHPPRGRGRGSVFNTGQILKGMMALWRWTGESRWLAAAVRGCRWLVDGLSPDGLWGGNDYRGSGTPSYYTEVIWMMLDVALVTGGRAQADLALQGLERILARRGAGGSFRKWGFGGADQAYCHTIAYTLRGIQESGRLMRREGLEDAATEGIRTLAAAARASDGYLPGAFDQQWAATRGFVCLTGNAQAALCILRLEERRPDPALLEAATLLMGVVCRTQSLDALRPGVRGAIAGSFPLAGSYMRFRYPNWAAIYTIEALLALIRRTEGTLAPQLPGAR